MLVVLVLHFFMYRVAQIKRHHSHHFTFLLVTNELIYKILSFFGKCKLQKATNEKVSTLYFFVNFCLPEGATKLSILSLHYGCFAHSLLLTFLTVKQCIINLIIKNL